MGFLIRLALIAVPLLLFAVLFWYYKKQKK
jgi:cbb3-type cytochrome oxidase subunit 3